MVRKRPPDSSLREKLDWETSLSGSIRRLAIRTEHLTCQQSYSFPERDFWLGNNFRLARHSGASGKLRAASDPTCCRLWCSRLGFEQRRHVRRGERHPASVDAGGVEEGGSDCRTANRVSGLGASADASIIAGHLDDPD